MRKEGRREGGREGGRDVAEYTDMDARKEEGREGGREGRREGGEGRPLPSRSSCSGFGQGLALVRHSLSTLLLSPLGERGPTRP